LLSSHSDLPVPPDLYEFVGLDVGLALVSAGLEANSREASMPLTDTACRAAKGRESEYKLSDGGGLYLLVKPSRARLLEPGVPISAVSRRSSSRPASLVPLVDARRLRDEAKKLLASGVDPGANKKAAKLTAVISATNTFGALPRNICNASRTRAPPRPPSARRTGWLLIDLAGRTLAADQSRISRRRKVLALLQQIERSGRRETARRLRSLIGTVFRLAVSTLRAEG
jgi:hypothetical protein